MKERAAANAAVLRSRNKRVLKPGHAWTPYTVTFDPGSLGLQLKRNPDPEAPGCFVTHVAPKTNTKTKKVRVNDKIVRVGHVQVNDAAQVTYELNQQPRPVTLTFHTQTKLDNVVTGILIPTTKTEEEGNAHAAVKDSHDDAKDATELGSEAGVDKGSSKAIKKISSSKAARKIARKMKTLQRLVVNRMQVVSSILSSIVWIPEMPRFLINFLTFMSNMFTINVPGLLSSPDCLGGESSGASPMAKWYLSMLIPFMVVGMFYVWYRCVSGHARARQTVWDAGVQVVFVWLFASVVTTCCKMFDFTGNFTGKLMLDTRLSLLDGWCIFAFILSIFVLIIFLFIPYSWFLLSRCCWCRHCCCCRNKKDGSPNSILQTFDWALEDYRFSRFEIWNVFYRTWIIVGSVTMFENNRFWTHMVLSSTSFLLHLCLRPYNDKATNFAAIMFSLCDFIGSFANYSPHSRGAQPFYIVVLLLTLVAVLIIAFQTIHERIDAIKNSTIIMNNNNNNDMFALYSKREKILLLPILAFVFVTTKIGQRFLPRRANTIIVPMKQEDFL
jgi:hypothetical protein